jgi:hypothetical protein
MKAEGSTRPKGGQGPRIWLILHPSAFILQKVPICRIARIDGLPPKTMVFDRACGNWNEESRRRHF